MLTVGSIAFDNAGWLMGAPLALGAPVVVHLLARTGGRKVVLPTMRFFAERDGGHKRAARLRDGLALLLRGAILLLVVGACARPIWEGRSDGVSGHDRRVVAYVLDRSASMQRARHGVPLFDEAKRRVVRSLRGLRPGIDRASVVLLDARPKPLLPVPTSDIENLMGMVMDVQPTFERGRTDAAVRLAVAQLRRADLRAGDPQRVSASELIVVSDLQGNTVDVINGLRTDRDLRVRTEAVGEASGNLALVGPTVLPARPVVGRTVSLGVHVTNLGRTTAPVSVQIELTFDGRTFDKRVEVSDGVKRAVSFDVTPKTAGVQWATFTIREPTPDRFRFDDQVGLAVRVDQKQQVALLSAADREDPTSATYYVARAVAPDEGNQQGLRTAVRPIRRGNEEDVSAALRSAVAAVAVETGEVGSLETRLLRAFVSRGGVLIWIVDSAASADSLRAFCGLGEGGAQALGAYHQSPPHNERMGWHLAETGFDQPLLGGFEGPAKAALLTQRFGHVFGFEGGRELNPVLVFEDRSSALSYFRIGRGAVAILGVDLAPNHSDLVKGPLLVPLLHEIIRVLTGSTPGAGVAFAGDRPMLELDWSGDARTLGVVGPAGDPTTIAATRRDDGRVAVSLGPVDRLGPYRVTAGDDTHPIGGLWVQVDPDESDLRVAGPIDNAAGRSGGNRGADGGGSTITGAIELWPYCVLAAILLAVADGFIARGWAHP